MSPISYQLDLEADVLLVLHQPNTQVLLPTETTTKLMSAEKNQKKSRTAYWPRDLESSTSVVRASLASQRRIMAMGANDESASAAGNSGQKSNPGTGEPDNPKQAEVQFQVSSKHLKLASPVFRAMLDGPWMEGTPSDGSCRTISTSKWNTESLLIFLNIIHGHHEDVPKSLKVETLCKLASIVDYYECSEIVRVFASRWHEALRAQAYYNSQSVLSLCVAWIFKWPRHFEEMTELALNYGEGPIETNDLPIGDMLERIEEKRQDIMSRIFDGIDSICDSLSGGENVCPFNCSSVFLDCSKEIYRINGFKRPEKPYNDCSVAVLLNTIANFQTRQWNIDGRGASRPGGSKPHCDLNERAATIFDDATASLKNFEPCDEMYRTSSTVTDDDLELRSLRFQASTLRVLTMSSGSIYF